MTPDEFWARVDRTAGHQACWPWLGGQNGNGRGRLRFNGRSQYAYRVAWELTHGEPIPGHLLACHSCDNPICVNPGHIFIGTSRDNGSDAGAKGLLSGWRRPSGLAHKRATVPPEVISKAVAEYLDGDESQQVVARRYGVSQSTLSDWLRGRTRKDSGLTPARKGRIGVAA